MMTQQRNINKIQTFIFVHKLYAYLLVLRYLQLISTKLKDKENEQENKGKAYVHDKNGNLTIKTDEDYDLDLEIEGWTYQYDYENRLIKITKNEKNETKTVTFKYDPFGRRIEKKIESIDKGIAETSVQTYVYDNEDIILEYLTKTSNGVTTTEATRYIHGIGTDEPLSMERNGNVYYYHPDGLGSIIALTDASGTVAQAYEYDSFGNLHDSMNAIKQPYTFTGREYDKETGLYYYRARYYDQEVGRFITKDPSLTLTGSLEIPYFLKLSLPFPSQLNPYIYTSNNPINLTDPQGLLVILPPPNLLSQIMCVYNEYLKGKQMSSKNFYYRHCVVSCNMARNCGKDIAYIAGFIKEIKDLLDMDPKSIAEFADILANLDGIDCCSSSLGCEKCCECEKGYKP